MTTIKRLAWCGLYRKPGAEGVSVVMGEHGAHFRDLQVCGSVWACPVCSAAIRQRRAAEIEQAARTHLAAGGGIAYVVLTVPHGIGDDLGELLRAVSGAWKATQQARGVRRVLDVLGDVGRIRSDEITHGRNGWHPHLNLLWFFERPLGPSDLEHLGDVLHAAWSAACVKRGLRAPSRDHGVRVQGVTLDGGGGVDVAAYISKVQDDFGQERMIGAEMTRGDLKQGRRGGSRLPFQIAAGAIAGEARDLALWWHYEQATKGRRCVEWSRGLRRRLLGQDVDLSDEQLAADPAPESERVAVLSDREWALVTRYGAQHRVLDAVEDHGPIGIWRLIAVLERRAAWDEGRAARCQRRLTL